MNRTPVRWDSDAEDFLIGEDARMWGIDSCEFIGSLEAVASASLTELNHAAARFRERQFDCDLVFKFYDAPEDLLREDEEDFAASPVGIEIGAGHVIVTVTTVVSPDIRLNRYEMSEILRPELERRKGVFLEVTDYDIFDGKVATISVEMRTLRARTVRDAMDLGEALLALWEASLGGVLTVETIADLVRAQRPELLIGQPETEWFEVKGSPYKLNSEIGALELAKDVSAFANTPMGGLLIVGFSRKKIDRRDHLKAVVPIPMKEIDPKKYRQALDRLILPPLEGLVIDAIETENDRGLLVLQIPPQPTALTPFLVIGAMAEGKVLGSYFSLYTRRGEDCEPASPSVIHGQLLAGRVALDGISRNPPADQ